MWHSFRLIISPSLSSPHLLSGLLYLNAAAETLGAAFPIAWNRTCTEVGVRDASEEQADVPQSENKQERGGEEQNQSRPDRKQTAVKDALN